LVPRALSHSTCLKQSRSCCRRRRLGAHCAAIGFGVALALSSAARAEDPPNRVGSLNYVSGEVSYALRGEGEPEASDALAWNQADFDQPVCEDMSLRTGEKARARIRIGPDAIEMSDETVLNMLNLTDRLIEASVRQGRIYLQVDKLGAGESVEIEIPRGSLWLLQPGGYDIEVGTADQPARITVFDGKARFVGGNADTALAAGEEVQIAGTYPAVTTTERSSATPNPAPAAPPATAGMPAPNAPPNPAVVPERNSENDGRPAANQPGPSAAADRAAFEVPGSPPAPAAHGPADDFLFFVAESKGDSGADQSARYVSSGTTGYDELDGYGRWETLADSEAVWFPSSVPAGWAPYRFGHWDSIAPWGWTWVDDEPWGFAPFHYGRWINLDGRWGWVPGPVASDPVYAPALVAFVDPNGGPGTDPNGGSDVGWFPLGPGDAYVPWYAAGPAYVERVNVAGHGGDGVPPGDLGRGGGAWRAPYANRQFATVVPRGTFADGRPVQQAIARIPADRLAQAAVMRGPPHVTPMARTVPSAEGAGGEASRLQEDRRPELSRNAAEHGGMPQHERAASRSPGEAHRGGAQQFRQPAMFRTPASSFGGRSFQTPQFGTRPAATHFGGGSSSASHHR
jgi:hypothetical protein